MVLEELRLLGPGWIESIGAATLVGLRLWGLEEIALLRDILKGGPALHYIYI
jgi:hypothetical protein